MAIPAARDVTTVNLKFLETLVCVAELNNLHQVAERLHTTQPTISSRIKALEQELGVTLIERGPRGVALTAKGMEAVAFARDLVARSNSMRARISDPATLGGIVRIGVIGTIIHTWLPSLIERLRGDYRKVIFEIESNTSVRMVEQLVSGQLDVGLLMGPVDSPGVGNVDLGAFDMAWVAKPGQFRLPPEIDVTDLADLPILSYPRGSKPYWMIEQYFRDSDVRRPLLNCSNSLASIIRLAIGGIGIAAIPPITIREELAAGQLEILPVRHVIPPLGFHASYRTGRGSELAEAIAMYAREEAMLFADTHAPMGVSRPQ
ncbi:LysR family transcriptional regulator [Lutibaculum baratangense]|uniref:Transcriptional regulator, LysR family n=1 Tax=Lutibaculum baratangense AMV1 TaxID=631454 RepID=V4RP34_9HYPH|nr:LysR family transcriptional regulator [Lutibaculum baratangense]ESR27024.1 transcriptional regulator, LysR family [Lutibaculum baratangense AMV1]